VTVLHPQQSAAARGEGRLVFERLAAKLRDGIPAGVRAPLRRRVRRLARPAWLGTLGRTTPLSSEWGFDRGTPIDRYYIEGFLAANRRDIRGRVVEVKDSLYTDRFGDGVERREILDIDAGNQQATIVADLAAADAVGSDQFDCFLLTQTLQLIYDSRAVVRHVHRMLRPGGVALVTVPCVSRIVPRYGLATDYWRFTPASCSALFAEAFGAEQVTVRSHGNVLSAVGFLAGVAYEELDRSRLDVHDPYFPVVISVRAVKQRGTAGGEG